MAALLPVALTSLGVSAGTAATIGTIASIGSTLFSIGSMFTGMKVADQQASAEIAATRYNAAIETKQAAEQEQKLRREQYLRAGSQMAAAGGQGRGFDGNVLDIMADTAYQSELDILGIRTSNQLSQQLAQSKIKSIKSSAKTSKMGSILTGVGDLLSSSSSVLGGYSAPSSRSIANPNIPGTRYIL